MIHSVKKMFFLPLNVLHTCLLLEERFFLITFFQALIGSWHVVVVACYYVFIVNTATSNNNNNNNKSIKYNTLLSTNIVFSHDDTFILLLYTLFTFSTGMENHMLCKTECNVTLILL